ncbi:1-acyl-sn-glycerol-3-phosphate acyltransferase [Borrelia nietonii YOR]|uniref:1-acyl-sn-glycerol-3-phosphate acyltransferase n=1 Tax=Borrelia nietonii YOR TaxID=1293576 RepID=A0ABM5PGE6_9SPIR|nr:MULTISPECIES: lysophospholipid acyltransferase family protein [Borrelia]AHH02988.1 1-acyl-sn-glycerol-3-phosphate acyltransferase [Borrelia nietonii YOR]AHH13541.1 1-acyl-sn-glycerol-3-phosphate acyltransferase [Borrelia hermsii MTW]UPA08782.1 1-acyl-sn-glycerol-3-phosphate acyltransferase [Borrelia nietonii YOR]
MKILRSIVTYINFFFFILIFTVLFPVFLIFKLFKFENHFINFSFILVRFAIKSCLWFAGIKVVITKDNDCSFQKGGVVIMANHIASMDPLFLIYVFAKPFVIVAKRSLLNIPLVNFLLISMGAIFVNRNSIKSSAITQRKATKVIQEGGVIGIFPEGTRNRGKDTKDFKRGSVNLALRTNSPIIPVTLFNTHKVFVKNLILNSGLSIYVHIHSLIDVSNLTNDEKERLHIIVRDKIVKKLEIMKIQYNIDRNLNEDK